MYSTCTYVLIPTLATCRCHVVAEFNRGIYDCIVATDEDLEFQPQRRLGGGGEGGGGGEEGGGVGGDRGRKGTKRKRKDKEYGVSRGIDFQGLWHFSLCRGFFCFGSLKQCLEQKLILLTN